LIYFISLSAVINISKPNTLKQTPFIDSRNAPSHRGV